MVDKYDVAINAVSDTTDKQQPVSTAINQQQPDRSKLYDEAIDSLIIDEQQAWKDDFFKGVNEYESYMKKQYGDDVFKKQNEIRNKQTVGRKLDMLAKFDKTPDELVDITRKAKAFGLKPSQLLDVTPETQKIIDDAAKRNSIKVDYSLYTPVTYDLLNDAIPAKISEDSIHNLQLVEDRLRKQREREEQAKLEKKQSKGLGDNLWYGVGQMATLSTRLRYLVADKFDSAITGAYGLAAGSESRMFANSAYNMRQYNRYKGIVDIAQQVDDLPHDLRIAKIAEEYDQHGVGASLSYFASNPTIASSLIAQSLPSIFSGGGVGKVGTGLLATGLERTALSAGVKNYLLKASTMGTIGAVSTAGMGYQQNVVHAYQKTGDYQKTIAEADKRTAVDSTFGFAGGLMPYFSKGGTWAGRALNVFTEATTQGLAGSTGAYYSAKSVGEEATGGELFLNFIMGYLTTPADIIAAKFSGGKRFDEPARADLQTANDVIVEIKNMALTQRDPETARQIIKNIKEQSDSGLQDVYIPAEEFNRYFQEQGIDPIEFADRVTGKQGALEEALATGADLQIPLENYAIDIVAKGHDTAFNETLRTAPDTMNAKELSEFDSQLKESTEELAKQIDESINKENAYLTDRAIYDNVFQQLKEAGIDKTSAERQALLYQALFNTLGQRLGVDPMSIFSNYHLKITRDGISDANSAIKRYAQTGDIKELFKPAKEDADNFRANLDKAINSLVSRNMDIELGDTPLVLQAIGAPNLKIRITRDTVRKATNKVKHDVSMDTVRNLPELLSDPIAIFKSSTENDALVVLVNAFDESNRPVIAAVHFDKFSATDRNLKVNKIASIYGKDNASHFINREIGQGNLLYQKDNKKPLLSSTVGLQLPKNGSHRKGSTQNVLNADDIVKLYQATEKKVNGFIEIANNSIRINLTENANLSTFLHETGHFFLETLGDISQREDVPADVKTDYHTILNWLGAEDRQTLSIEQHEKFARGFEAYLMEGKAPSLELQSAFTRFKAWLTQIYKVIRNLDVRLNDDVRRVFDRMLATDEAIEVARAPYQEVFSNAEQAGMSPKEFAAYQEIAAKANEEAKEKLLNQSLKEISRERTNEWKEAKQAIKQEVITELQDNPIYVLDDFLKRGVDKNGQQVLEVQKLDAELIKSIYGDEVAKQLKRFTQKEGLHPDVVAEMFGFESTDTMVQQLATKPSNEAMVNAETKARLTERFGDILLDGSMADKAILAVENEGRAKVLEAELKAINKQRELADRIARIKVADANKSHKEAQEQAIREQKEAEKADRQAKREAFDSIAPEKILREASRQVISNRTVKDIKPHLYLNAERKANKQAFAAVQKGDWDAAAKAKEQERLNHFLYLEAIKALDTTERIVKHANRLNKQSSRERINKVSKDGLEQLDNILEQYEFKQVSDSQLERRQSLRNYLDDLAANGIEPDIPEFVIDNARQVNYKELSFEQLQAVHDSLKAIETVSRLKNKLISNQKQRDFAEFKEEALQSLNDNVPVNARTKATSSLSETAVDKVLGNISKHNANSANLATLTYRADGLRADGVFSNSIYKPIRDAELRQRELTIKHAHVFNDILKGVSGKYLKQKAVISSLGGYMIAKGEAIMIALNCGNESNKSRLLKGGIKTRDSVNALPLTEQSISEVLGTLNKQDWALVQSVWQMFDDMKPETKELYRTLNGTEFKEIEAGTLQTAFGEIKGGYFPLVYDHDVAAVPNGVMKKTLFNEGRQSALPSNGYTKAREDKVKGTVNLDINQLPNKLNEHVLDLTHRKALIDANKILTDPEISAALKQKLGIDNYNALFKSIHDIANISPEKGIGAWASWLQKNAAVYYLGASLSTMINQMPGAFQILKYVNPLDYGREIVSTIGHYKDNLKFIMDSSPAMRDRWRSMDLSSSVYSKLQGKGKLAVTHENIQTIALAYMPIFERVFSVPAWMAIYKREMASGTSHEQAVMQADVAVIKSQGGFLNVDKNAYQRNKAIAPFYMFASPFAAVYNSFVDSAFAVRQGKSTAVKEVMTNLAIISLAGFGYSLATGQKDDKDSYAKFYVTSSLSYATSGIPFVRDIVNFTVDAKGRSAMSTPIASTTTNIISQTKKWQDPEKAKFDKTVAAFAAVTGTPLKPITVQGAAIKDLVTGDYKPDNAFDTIKHILYRKNKPE